MPSFAVYLYVTNLKGVTRTELDRDLNMTQKITWLILHRLRDAWDESGLEKFVGPVEVDETHMSGKRKQMTVGGAVGKTAVVGDKDRERNAVAADPMTDLVVAMTGKRLMYQNLVA